MKSKTTNTTANRTATKPTPVIQFIQSERRAAFMAGYNAGCDHMEPSCGPGRYAKDADEAYKFYLEDIARKIAQGR